MIKRLTVDDLNIFREIREEAMRTNPESFGNPKNESPKQLDVHYRHWLEGEMWGAFEDANLGGIAGFYISSQNCGEIFTMYVRSAYRSKGIGDRLVKSILNEAKNRVDMVSLCVVHTAQAAIKTCLKNGFEICHTDVGAFRHGDKVYDEHLMMKRMK